MYTMEALREYDDLLKIKMPGEETSYPYCIMDRADVIETTKRIELTYQNLAEAMVDKSSWSKGSDKWSKSSRGPKGRRHKRGGGEYPGGGIVTVIDFPWE